ncbi:uncharacterized protein B0H18DRAFT_908859 [Fomitopsis serialis]|uniref:uncharacterized protein n=1 Tax=Fomitopsis serialis TaxID=139415 RepID=UPI0020074213|nr:uncharacterized protein B0H18DRAFT_908859 [Neoantrodia serialis]KAH9925111.1 hypothetical protein B0H18DRAFT_908859 [Neoantrodia serialis]
MLEDHSSGRPLLPRLRTLVVIEIDATKLGALMLLISPSLRRLRMSFMEGSFAVESASHSQPSATDSLLPHVIAAVPDLTDFWIECGLPEDLPPRYLSELARLERLEKLNIIYSGAVVDHEALRCISYMTALRAVELSICLDSIGLSEPLQLGEAFLGLEDVHLSGSIHDIRRVFEAVQFPKLASLGLSISTAPTMEVLTDSLAMVCDRVSRSTTEVHLFISAEMDSPDISLSDILQPYLPFREMTSMNIEFDYHLPGWQDEDMLAFADAWPVLDHFYLACAADAIRGAPLPLPSQPTVAGLIELARRCPRLRYVTMPSLDVRTLPSPREVPPVEHQSMQYLEVSRYVGGGTANLLDLAVILDVLFPRLKRKRCCVRAKDGVAPDNTDAEHLSVRMTELLLAALSARRELLDGTPTAEASGGPAGWGESAQADQPA